MSQIIRVDFEIFESFFYYYIYQNVMHIFHHKNDREKYLAPEMKPQ